MNKIDKVGFSKLLIKGRIAETVFEQMFRDTEKYTVIPFGYENSFPEIAQYQQEVLDKRVLDNLRSSPDFALITNDRKRIYLVEVKYMSTLEPLRIKTIAEKQKKRWDPSFIFIASRNGFYLDNCNSIINNAGQIKRLSSGWIPTHIQKQYLELLCKFES